VIASPFAIDLPLLSASSSSMHASSSFPLGAPSSGAVCAKCRSAAAVPQFAIIDHRRMHSNESSRPSILGAWLPCSVRDVRCVCGSHAWAAAGDSWSGGRPLKPLASSVCCTSSIPSRVAMRAQRSVWKYQGTTSSAAGRSGAMCPYCACSNATWAAALCVMATSWQATGGVPQLGSARRVRASVLSITRLAALD
jgi:hypothetical protein